MFASKAEEVLLLSVCSPGLQLWLLKCAKFDVSFMSGSSSISCILLSSLLAQVGECLGWYLLRFPVSCRAFQLPQDHVVADEICHSSNITYGGCFMCQITADTFCISKVSVILGVVSDHCHAVYVIYCAYTDRRRGVQRQVLHMLHPLGRDMAPPYSHRRPPLFRSHHLNRGHRHVRIAELS